MFLRSIGGRRWAIIVDLRINETLQTGAVGNRTYRVGASVYLFLEFTIIHTRHFTHEKRTDLDSASVSQPIDRPADDSLPR